VVVEKTDKIGRQLNRKKVDSKHENNTIMFNNS
jgi:hypothetical protein